MRATKRQTEAVRAYMEDQAHEQVIHLEKAASELVGPVRHDIWRRWEQAFEPYESGDEAENFQAVGVRLRECLISFIIETANDDLVPLGEVLPQGTNFRAWSELLANTLASGKSNEHLRSYLKKLSVETWEYVNWLTHAKNAIRPDADIGLKAVEHLLLAFTAARARLRYPGTRCADCGSYRLVGGTCEHCGWVDPDYEPSDMPPKRKSKWTRRPKDECTPSSDISTFMRPEDVT